MMVKKLNYRRLFVLVAVISLSLVYAVIWARTITDNALRTGTDFIAFYAGGRVSQEFGFSSAYDIALQKKIQEEQVGFSLAEQQILLYNHLPFLLPVLTLVVSENYVLSFIVWTLCLLGCYGLSLAILKQILHSAPSGALSQTAYWGGGLLFFPVFISLLLGQDTAILFLGMTIWLVGLATKRDWLAGLGLGLTAVRPHMAWLLTLPFLFNRRGVFLWAASIGLAIAAFSIWLIGWQGTQDFLTIISISAGGEWYGMNENEMYNLIGIFFRVFPQIERELIRLAAWWFYILAIAGLCVAWKKSPIINEKLTSITILLALLAAPHLHYHDLAVLLLPLVFVVNKISQSGNVTFENALLIFFGASFVLLFSFFISPLKFVAPYLLGLTCAFILLYQTNDTAQISQRGNTP